MLHQKAPKANSIEDTKICQKENGRDVIHHSAYNCDNTLNNCHLTRTRSIESTEKVKKRDFEPLETANCG